MSSLCTFWNRLGPLSSSKGKLEKLELYFVGTVWGRTTHGVWCVFVHHRKYHMQSNRCVFRENVRSEVSVITSQLIIIFLLRFRDWSVFICLFQCFFLLCDCDCAFVVARFRRRMRQNHPALPKKGLGRHSVPSGCGDGEFTIRLPLKLDMVWVERNPSTGLIDLLKLLYLCADIHCMTVWKKLLFFPRTQQEPVFCSCLCVSSIFKCIMFVCWNAWFVSL